MSVFSLDDPSIKSPMLPGGAVALGFFDGCHLGHQKILETCRASVGGNAGVLTFSEHPGSVIPGRQAPKLLTTSGERIRLLEENGLGVFLKVFDRDFSTWSCERFAEEILARRMGVSHVVAGYDYRFGHRAMGDVEKLARLGQKLDFSVTVVPALSYSQDGDDLIVSSTKIRQAIAEGELELATHLLGRPYFALSTVIKGSQRGRTIDFPTANMEFPQSKVAPPYGVMAIKATIADGTTYGGVANFGVRPTVDRPGVSPLFEAHLFNFKGDLYGQKLYFEMLYYLRSERKFNSLAELREQILVDSKRARALVG